MQLKKEFLGIFNCFSKKNSMSSKRKRTTTTKNHFVITLFKLAFICCVFRKPNTLDSIEMRHEPTRTFTSKLVTTLDVDVFNLFYRKCNVYSIYYSCRCYQWKSIKFVKYWLSVAHKTLWNTLWHILYIHTHTKSIQIEYVIFFSNFSPDWKRWCRIKIQPIVS